MKGSFASTECLPLARDSFYHAGMNAGFSIAAVPTDLPTSGSRGRESQPPGWRLALLSICAFWLVYFLLASAKSLVGDLPAQDEMLLRRGLVTLAAIGLTWLLYMLLRAFQSAGTGRQLGIAFAASVPLAFAYATVNYIAFYRFPIAEHMALGEEKYDSRASQPLAVITGSALEWYFFIATWAVMWVAIGYSEKVRDAERRAAHFAQAAKESELRALRYQVNPHFLFNTLNSLSSLVMRERSEEAEQMILNLATFFRASLTRDATESVPLAEEVRMQLLYLDIEKVRFPERLVVVVDVPASLGDALVPGLILQPLVENAIKYGVSRSQRPVTVRISAEAVGSAEASGDVLHLTVRDDGELQSPHSSDGCGVGLANVRDRLAASFGDAASLICGPAVEGGYAAHIALPLTRGR